VVLRSLCFPTQKSLISGIKNFPLTPIFEKYFFARYAIFFQSLYFNISGSICCANSAQSHCAQAFHRKKPL
jgi:hypothetical protein